ncbi:MAG: co-chaperone GroES [Salinibacterium sp.]|nr:MAG: co-chaperone GroES [Salinibacterium sp.]
MARIRPLHSKVLIRRKEGAGKVGRILIPENAKEVPCEGEVLSVGNDVKEFGAGAVVLFSKYAGTEVKLEDGLALMMNEEDVLAVVEER